MVEQKAGERSIANLTDDRCLGYFYGFPSALLRHSRNPMPKAAPPIHPISFEAALEELESIVQTMEAGQLPLETSLAAYQRGIELLKHCQDALAAAEQKIQILEGGALRDFSLNSNDPPAD
jgi:exodeoxyribonuclease VII small subunit